jgi:antitoxin HicB
MADPRMGFDRYTIELRTEVDGTYCASLTEIAGVTAAGHDPDETVSLLRDSFDLWVADATATSDQIPLPVSAETVSGRFLLRMPRDLHARAAREAARQGASLNTWIVAALAERLGAGTGSEVQLGPRDRAAG